MNIIFEWLKKHPDVEIDLEYHRDCMIFVMRCNGNILKNIIPMIELEKFRDIDIEFTFDTMLYELGRRHSGTMAIEEG